MIRRSALLLCCCAGFAAPSEAVELFRHQDFSIELSGSLREVAQAGRQTDADDFTRPLSPPIPPLMPGDPRCFQASTFRNCSAFGTVGEEDAFQSLTRVRTRLDIAFTSYLNAVVVYDHEVRAGELNTLGGELADGFSQDDFLDAEWTEESHHDVEWRHLFYRGYLELETEHLDISVGRQRIAWGVGRLWNPIDRFNAIPPLAVQGDQSQGIDSINTTWAINGFHSLQAVYAPGPNRNHARYAMRYSGVIFDSDVSLMGGVFEEARTAGVDFARNLGDAAVRFEVVYTRPHQKVWKIESSRRRRLDEFVQAVFSIDYTFDVADGIYVLLEHLYNGNALGFGGGRAGNLLPLFEAREFGSARVPMPGTDALFGSSRVVTNAESQTGLLVGGDITADLRLDMLTIYDWDGDSAAFAPSLKYTPLDALEVTFGVQAFAGPHLSQYGSAQAFAFLLVDVFF